MPCFFTLIQTILAKTSQERKKSPLLVEVRRSKRRCLSSPLFTATIVRAAKQYHGSLLTTKMGTMVVFFGFVVFRGHDNLSLLVDFVT